MQSWVRSRVSCAVASALRCGHFVAIVACASSDPSPRSRTAANPPSMAPPPSTRAASPIPEMSAETKQSEPSRECEPGARLYTGVNFCRPQVCTPQGRWTKALLLYCPAWAYFARGSADLLQNDMEWLGVAVGTMAEGGITLQVTGMIFRDPSRVDRGAEALARQRAERVRDLLIARGAPPDRMRVALEEATPYIIDLSSGDSQVGAVVSRAPSGENARPQDQ